MGKLCHNFDIFLAQHRYEYLQKQQSYYHINIVKIHLPRDNKNDQRDVHVLLGCSSGNPTDDTSCPDI